MEHFGLWAFNQKNGELSCRVGRSGFRYRVPVGAMKSSEEVSEWVQHVKEKRWCTPPLLADFLKAVNALTSHKYRVDGRGQNFTHKEGKKYEN